jgi:hypothetical protein
MTNENWVEMSMLYANVNPFSESFILLLMSDVMT